MKHKLFQKEPTKTVYAFKALTTETFGYPLAAVSSEKEHFFHFAYKTLI